MFVEVTCKSIRSYAVERYQGIATQTVHAVRQVAITRREPTA